MHRDHRVCVLLVVAAVFCGAETAERPDWAYDFDVVEGDMQVERVRGRDGKVLGSTPLTRKSQLFPSGELVHYYMDPSIGTADRRVPNAVQEWEQKTCFRFRRCGTESSCPRPYLRFYAGSGCSSPVGMRRNGVNSVSLAWGCTTGAAVHEIGHSLGLSHEQTRKDRDQFVRIDFTQIWSGMHHNFHKNHHYARDLGAYDYGSIMHYGPNDFATGRQPTIISPRVIGQRHGLSPTDVAAIHFMYNDCSPTFSRPRCLPSVDARVTHVVEASQTFAVDFNALYDSTRPMTVSYGGSAPSGQVRYARAAGSAITDTGFAAVTFTPSHANAGQTHALSATFTGSDGAHVTCSVSVRVGRNTAPAPPTPVPRTWTYAPPRTRIPPSTRAPPRTSHPVTAPPTTNAPPTTPQPPRRTPPPSPVPQPSPPTTGGCRTHTFGFDTQSEVQVGSHVQLSSTRWHGAGSLMVRRRNVPSIINVDPTGMQVRKFSVFVRVESTNARVEFRLHSPRGGIVNVMHADNGALSHTAFDGHKRTSWEASARDKVQKDAFQLIEVEFDWTRRTYTVFLDRNAAGHGSLPYSFDGISDVQFTAWYYSPVFVDEMQLRC